MLDRARRSAFSAPRTTRFAALPGLCAVLLSIVSAAGPASAARPGIATPVASPAPVAPIQVTRPPVARMAPAFPPGAAEFAPLLLLSQHQAAVVEVDLNGDGLTDHRFLRRFDARGLPVEEELSYGDIQGPHRSFTYDEAGRLTAMEQANVILSWTYDDDGRLVQACHTEDPGMLTYEPDNHCVVFSYDRHGRLAERRRTPMFGSPSGPTERLARYSYTPLSRRDPGGLQAERREFGADGDLVETIRWTYDEDGALLSTTWDGAGTPEIDRTVREERVDGVLVRRITESAEGRTVEYFQEGRLMRTEGRLDMALSRSWQSQGVVRYRY